MILLVLALSAVIFFGLIFLQVIKQEKITFLDLGWGYLLGIGLFTNVIFITNWLFKIPFDAYSLWLELAALICFASWALWIRKKILPLQLILDLVKSTHRSIHDFLLLSKLEKLTTIGTFLLVFSAIGISLFLPVKDWDSIVLYDFRAIVFAYTGGMEEAIERGYFFGYPLLTSLAHTWVYLNGFQFPGIIHSLLYASFILIASQFLSRHLTRKWLAICCFFLTALPVLYIHAIMTYTNLAYSVYFCAGILEIVTWAKSKKDGDLLLASIMLGLSTWSRSAEPFWLLTIPAVFITAIVIKKLKVLIWYLIPIFLIRQPWLYLQNSYFKSHNLLIDNPNTRAFAPQYLFDLSRIISVIQYYYLYILKPFKYEIILFMLVLIQAFLVRKKIGREVWLLPFIIFSCLALTFLGIYIFSVRYEDWINIGGSSTRMIIFLPPLIFIFAFLVLQHVAKKKI